MPSAVASSAFRLMLRALLAAGPRGSELASVARRAAVNPLSDAESRAEAAIDLLRLQLADSDSSVRVIDFGAGTGGGRRPPDRRVADVYRRASSGPLWGRFLGALVRELRPTRVLELGTNLGVSAAHIAAQLASQPHPSGRLITLEGAPALADLATTNLLGLGHSVGPEGRVEIVVGAFAETLVSVCAEHGPFDLVFVDGHHEEQATLDYVRFIRPHLTAGAVVVLDDVEPGRSVWRAWRQLARLVPKRSRVYLGRYGLLTFDNEGETQSFRTRLDTRDQEPASASY